MRATPGAPPTGPTGWRACPRCRALVYGQRFARELHVCSECGWHGPLTAQERIEQLFDKGAWGLLYLEAVTCDHLGWVDAKPYIQRLGEARTRTGLSDAVLCARGTIEGQDVLAAVMDFRFLGGSLGAAVGEIITTVAEMALADHVPFLMVTASGGARMQEGAISLMQMAKTSQALAQLDEAGVLTISLITDPTYGGVAASFATASDIIISEPGARMGFAGPRVIEQTIKKVLPEGFQTAESLIAHGLIDSIHSRATLRPTLGRLLSVARRDRRARKTDRRDPLIRDPDLLPRRDPWAVVKLARNMGRPTTLDYVGLLVDAFVELHGDRASADCSAIVGGIGHLDGLPLMVIGHQKGHTPHELMGRNFAMATPAGYRKAARLMSLAGKLGLPIVTLIDTPGAYPGVEAEQQGQAIRIAEALRLMSRLSVPIVAVITGEGGSGGALALGLADRVIMSANAIYSVISPEGCAAILWKDRSAAPLAAAELGLEARDLLRLGIVDGVLPEPVGGAHQDHERSAEWLGDALLCVLRELLPIAPERLLAERRTRFRRFGTSFVSAREEVAG